MSTYIKTITVSELDELLAMMHQTFQQQYENLYSQAFIEQMLSTDFDKETVLKAFENEDSAFYWLIDQEQKVGYMKLNVSYAQTQVEDPVALEIEYIAILKQYQSKELFDILVTKAIVSARELAKMFVWVAIDKKQDLILDYFQKLDFYQIGAYAKTIATDQVIYQIYRKDI